MKIIEEKELLVISKKKGISIRNAEKDYLLELLLFALYKEAGRKLVFKGGTALYKFHSLNRFSEDLDFTLASSKFDITKLFEKVRRTLGEASVHARIKEVSDYQKQKNIRLELRGPLFDGNPKTLSQIIINISLKEKPLCSPEQKMLFSNYREIVSFDVFLMPLEELFAEKVRALMSRDKARDVYDLWFLLMKGVKPDMAIINKKLKLYDHAFSYDDLIKKVDEKKKSWEMDLKDLLIGGLPAFEDVKKAILERFKAKS